MVIHLLDLKEDNKVPGWNYAKSIEGLELLFVAIKGNLLL